MAKEYTIEEIMAMKPQKTKQTDSKEKEYTLEEIQAMSGSPDEPSFAEDALELAQYVGEGVDRYTGAPTRSAIKAATEGSNPFSAFASQWGEPTKGAPTGIEVAKAIGVPSYEVGGMVEAKNPAIMSGETDEPMLNSQEVAGLAIDVFADPTMLLRLPLKTAQLVVKSSPKLQRKLLEVGGQKVLKTFLDEIPVSKIGKLMEKTGAERSVGNVLLEYNLGRHSGNPEKLLEEIAGKVEKTYEKIGSRQRMVGAKRTGGLVEQKAKEVDDIIDKLSKSKKEIEGSVYSGSRITDGESIKKDLMDYFSELQTKPGQATDALDLKQKEKILNKYLGKYMSKAQKDMFKGDVNPYMSFKDLNELKRGIGKRLREDIFKKEISDKIAKEDEVLTKLYLYLKDEIEDMAKSFDPELGEQLINANMDSHALQTLKSALVNIPAKELKKMGGVEALGDIIGTGAVALTSYGAGAALGESVSTPLVLGLTGMYGASRGLPKRIGKSIRNLESKGLQKIQSGQLFESPVTRGVMTGADIMRGGSAVMQEEPIQEALGRAPQSIDPVELAERTSMMISDTEIPRDTQWIKDHPKVFLMRLRQANPQLALQMKLALDKGNDSVLRKTIPLVAQQVPEIFEFDEFGSFDGKIIDPAMKQLYTERVMEDSSLDAYQKTVILDHLNRTNEVLK
jgi:CRISPR/Cas system-associated endoribonuclease Cas2